MKGFSLCVVGLAGFGYADMRQRKNSWEKDLFKSKETEARKLCQDCSMAEAMILGQLGPAHQRL